MIQFAKYGFNLAHSLAYAFVSYRCFYVKYHYPIEFFTALLNNTKPDYDADNNESGKMESYCNNARKMGIKVLPPNVNKSGVLFKIEDENIRMGLETIKDVGHTASISIEETQPYKNINDFMLRTNSKVNKKVVEALAKVGAFDCFCSNRKSIMLAITKYYNKGKKGKVSDYIIKKVKDYDLTKKLLLEKDRIGFYLSNNPLEGFRDIINKNHLVDINTVLKKGKGILACVINNVKVIETRTNKKMAFVLVSDEDEVLDITVWPEMLDEYNEELKTNNIVAIKVKKQRNKKTGGYSYVIANDDYKRQVISLKDLKNKE
jgi:DNA polymerase-3 subunit alpha